MWDKEGVRGGYDGNLRVHVGVVPLVAFVVGVDGACGWVVGLERLLARAACQGAAPMAAATRAAARTAPRVGIRWGLGACKKYRMMVYVLSMSIQSLAKHRHAHQLLGPPSGA